MSTAPITLVDSLALLSMKVASNVFDLSSGMFNVSIRDQMVRAQLIVRDLRRADPGLKNLLIVGAGAAGMTAALSAAQSGIANVVVLETKSEPFFLFKGVTERHVGPFMYEWPSVFFDDQSYPKHSQTPWSGFAKSPLTWSSQNPCSADALAGMLSASLIAAMKKMKVRNRPLIFVGQTEARVHRIVKDFANHEAARNQARLTKQPLPNRYRFRLPAPDLWTAENKFKKQKKPKLSDFAPQYIILAAGMGYEDLKLVKLDWVENTYTGSNPECLRFWENDQLLNVQTCDKRIAIFGGGDGALQDVLRALTGFAHPLELLRKLESVAGVRRALHAVAPDLLALDRQGRQFATWTTRHEEFRALDGACRSIAGQLAGQAVVAKRVQQLIRRGKGAVTLVVRETYFDKTYLLNRFMVHLLDACAQAGAWPGRMGLDVRFHSRACGYRDENPKHEIEVLDTVSGRVTTIHADEIAVRYGIERDTVPGAQMIQVSDARSRHRTTMARIELPFVMA